MRVLVTGASGFVGGWLVRELHAGGHVVFGGSLDGLPNPGEPAGVEWLRLDVASSSAVRAALEIARPDAVFHLAGQSSVGASFRDPLGTWDVNATGTMRVASALPPGARLLLASSAEVYGVVPEGEQPIGEARPLRPANPYAASKAAAEMAVLHLAAEGRSEVVIARSFNHTGPGQDLRFALPSFARQLAQARAGRAEPLLRVGNLAPRRDLTDVRDVVRAYLLLMEVGSPGEVYNVCSGEAVAMRDAVETLVELSGTGARIQVDADRFRTTDVPLLCGDPRRLSALGWAPTIPLRRTLADLLEWQDREAAVGAGAGA